MYIVGTAGSAAVRIDVEPLRPAESFDKQAHSVKGALDAARKLQAWAQVQDLSFLRT